MAGQRATFRTLLPHLVDHVTCHVIDLPSAGSSRFDDDTTLTIDQHIHSVRRVVDLLELDEVAAVGHDSGGLIARHALVGGRGGERFGQGQLQLQADRAHHLGDQIVLGGEVVDDDPVAGPEALREPTERELAESVVEHRIERSLQDVVLAVLAAHRGRS